MIDEERTENESEEPTDTDAPPEAALEDLDVTAEEGADVKAGYPPKITGPRE